MRLRVPLFPPKVIPSSEIYSRWSINHIVLIPECVFQRKLKKTNVEQHALFVLNTNLVPTLDLSHFFGNQTLETWAILPLPLRPPVVPESRVDERRPVEAEPVRLVHHENGEAAELAGGHLEAKEGAQTRLKVGLCSGMGDRRRPITLQFFYTWSTLRNYFILIYCRYSNISRQKVINWQITCMTLTQSRRNLTTLTEHARKLSIPNLHREVLSQTVNIIGM